MEIMEYMRIIQSLTLTTGMFIVQALTDALKPICKNLTLATEKSVAIYIKATQK